MIKPWPTKDDSEEKKWISMSWQEAEDILEAPPAIGLAARDEEGQRYIISLVDVYNHQVKFTPI